MASKEASLKINITQLLNAALGKAGSVSCPDDQLTIVISKKDCDENFGQVVSQIHRVIEQYCPDRGDHLFILVRDENGSFKNILKIWKPEGDR